MVTLFEDVPQRVKTKMVVGEIFKEKSFVYYIFTVFGNELSHPIEIDVAHSNIKEILLIIYLFNQTLHQTHGPEG